MTSINHENEEGNLSINKKNHIYGVETLLIIGPQAEGMSLDSGKQNNCLPSPPLPQPKRKERKGAEKQE